MVSSKIKNNVRKKEKGVDIHVNNSSIKLHVPLELEKIKKAKIWAGVWAGVQ